MIARHESYRDKTDIWSKIAAPLPEGAIQWRQDGKISSRDGRHFARFVAYVDAQFVRERLDSVVPGEWDLTLELLPPPSGAAEDESCSFKARLQILGVIREDIGSGKDYKQASSDAFKRCAVRFGVAHELYAYEQNWVQMDGDGKYAKPLEDPAVAYARRYGTGAQHKAAAAAAAPVARHEPNALAGEEYGASGQLRPLGEREQAAEEAAAAKIDRQRAEQQTAAAQNLADRAGVEGPGPEQPRATEERPCPKCGGRTWDNRATKRNPKAPDFKCRDRSCDGVIWPPREGEAKAEPKPPRDAREVLDDDDDLSALPF